MLIRALDQKDITPLISLFNLYLQFYKRPPNLAEAKKFLEEHLLNKTSFIFGAFLEKEMVAFVQLYPTFSSLAMKPILLLNDLYVTDTHRRQGVARGLMTRAADFAKENGYLGLMLQTSKHNEKAQALYESLGWKKDTEFLTYTLKS